VSSARRTVFDAGPWLGLSKVVSGDTNQDYGRFLGVIKKSIRAHQLEAMRAVNRELVALYWEIGKAIQRKQEQLGWGKSVVETLAKDLQAEFPGRNGFSARNLWAMRDLYRTYMAAPKLQPLVAELGWSKNLLIMWRCKDALEREFYLRTAARNGWTKAVLQHQLANKTYEKYLLSQSSFEETLPKDLQDQAILAVKDHYSFEFLELAEQHSERELERALVGSLRSFLTELGGDFAFVGSQYRLEVGGQEYFIDLLLFHRRLRCLVAVELKIGDFKPEHKGKMEFYLEALDSQERIESENPPIGIIVCRSKNKTVVEYALRTAGRAIGVASYSVVPQLPENYRDQLPSPEAIAARLENL
jgi:predicted nuclease of restriction endonuclease-like (RecB) superfamily